MKLEDILDEWEKDAKIDRTNLGNEAIAIPALHNKYYRIFIQEKLLLRKYQEEQKQLKLAKTEFYFMGPTAESEEKGWKLPPQGKILKADVPNYVEADKDVVHLNLKVGVQLEKVEFVMSIIKSLTNRGFQIKSAIDWSKFQSGVF
jgi:hypothetical protein